MKKKLPKSFQSVFPSVPFGRLEIEKDKEYIIHQLFAFEGLKHWRYLFKTYSLKTLINVFIKKPAKIYPPATFNFVKNILLGLKDKSLRRERYVINTPRIIDKNRKNHF